LDTEFEVVEFGAQGLDLAQLHLDIGGERVGRVPDMLAALGDRQVRGRLPRLRLRAGDRRAGVAQFAEPLGKLVREPRVLAQQVVPRGARCAAAVAAPRPRGAGHGGSSRAAQRPPIRVVRGASAVTGGSSTGGSGMSSRAAFRSACVSPGGSGSDTSVGSTSAGGGGRSGAGTVPGAPVVWATGIRDSRAT